MSKNNSLKVLLAGAECAPFVKLGGLADVMGTLPKELNQIGADARVIMPFHSQMNIGQISTSTLLVEKHMSV